MFTPLVFSLFLVIVVQSANATAVKEKRQAAGCAVWQGVLQDLQANLFKTPCGQQAHDSIRMTFHDAVAWSSSNPSLAGGADGSLMRFAVETTYLSNAGTARIVAQQRPFADNHGVSYADFIQFAGAVALSTCPGSPKLPFLAGRKDGTKPAPDLLVPLASDSSAKILSRFADAGFAPQETVALLAAHSVGSQSNIDPSVPGWAFDSTPNVFDTQFHLETMLAGIFTPPFGTPNTTAPLKQGEARAALPGAFRLQSDSAIARDPTTACAWQSYVNSPGALGKDFQAAMLKLSIVGQNQASLIDCSSIIPNPLPLSRGPHFPSGTQQGEIQQVCPNAFPAIPTNPGTTTTSIPPVPPNVASTAVSSATSLSSSTVSVTTTTFAGSTTVRPTTGSTTSSSTATTKTTTRA